MGHFLLISHLNLKKYFHLEDKWFYKKFQNYEQHDSHEFLTQLIDELNEDTKNVYYNKAWKQEEFY